MSQSRLLSLEPLARRRGSAMDDRAKSGASTPFRALNLLTAVWGLTLLVSAAVLIVFALLTPRVAFFSDASARDAEIHSIKSVTDVGLLQGKAVLDVSQGYASGTTATFLCHIALGTLLFMIIGSIGSLLLIRWMKSRLKIAEDDI